MDANRRESAEKSRPSVSFDRFIPVYWRSFAVDLKIPVTIHVENRQWTRIDANQQKNLGLQSVFDRFIRVYWRSFAVDPEQLQIPFRGLAISVD